MKEYKINETQIKAVVDYLAQHKYADVYQGVQMLTTLEEIKAKEEVKEKE